MKSNSVVFTTQTNSDELRNAARPKAGALPPDEIHLYYEVLDPAVDAARAAAARSILTEDEWKRCQRFAYTEGVREQLAARVMVRSALSRYAPVGAGAWRFTENAYGRPEVAEPFHATGLRFNLSHSHGVVTLAVSASHAVGIDVEHVGRTARLAVADRFFAPAEIAALRALPVEQQPRRFLGYWTLKEAYIKARGAGLSLPLDRFAFDLDDRRRPTITFADDFDDDARAWQFDQLFVGPEHLVAVATRVGDAPPISVLVHTFDGTVPDAAHQS